MYDGTPKGYTFLKIDGNSYVLDYKAAGKPATYQMNIYHPKIIARNQGGQGQIVVNFFMGNRTNKVEYRIDEGKWTPMTWFEGIDPAYQELVSRWDRSEVLLTGRRPSNPQPCSHLWRAGLPAIADPGIHTIDVRATGMFGQTFSDTSTFKVADPVKF